MSKILYLSCHEILEYDEVKLLNELGHYVFSPGAYLNPSQGQFEQLRPGLSLAYDPEDVRIYMDLHLQNPLIDVKKRLSRELVDRFDTIIVMHEPSFITNNWNTIKDKRVIWRTIGQSTSSLESQIKRYVDQGLQIVRYSPAEQRIPGYAGCNSLIRFYKDPAEFGNWTGENKQVITLAQSMIKRSGACNFSYFEAATHSFKRTLLGTHNAEVSWNRGPLTYLEVREELRTNAVYFYTGTQPASYTLNFIEAWMTGIPIVAIGSQHGGHLYEVDQLIDNEVTGFYSDDLATSQKQVRDLLNDYDLSKQISATARARAIELFSKEQISEQWMNFLNNV